MDHHFNEGFRKEAALPDFLTKMAPKVRAKAHLLAGVAIGGLLGEAFLRQQRTPYENPSLIGGSPVISGALAGLAAAAGGKAALASASKALTKRLADMGAKVEAAGSAKIQEAVSALHKKPINIAHKLKFW